MALTAYPSVITPTLPAPIAGGGDTSGTTHTVSILATWGINDYYVAIFNTDGTADPTSVVSVVGAIAFTKAFGANGTSIWYARNTSGSAQVSAQVTATYAAACVANMGAFVVTNVSSSSNAAVVGTNSAASTAANTDILVTAATGAVLGPTGLVVGIIGTKKVTTTVHTPATLVAKHANPSSMGAYQDGIAFNNGSGSGLALEIAATLNEEICDSSFIPYEIAMWDTSGTGNVASAGCILYFPPASVSLDDNTVLVGTGPLLNNPNNTLPLYDIETIQGLSDMSITNDSSAIDGTDGSYVSAKFASGKTIIIDGTIYGASSPFDEGLVDVLKQAYNPSSNPLPFYFKPSNQNPRVISAYPIGIKSDIDRNRASLQCPYELQFLTAEAFASSLTQHGAYGTDNAGITSTSVSVSPTGNTESFPVIYFNVLATDSVSQFVFYNTTWIQAQRPFLKGPYTNNGINITITGAVAGMYKLDLQARMLWRLDPTGYVDVSNMITGRTWWSLLPNLSNSITMTKGTVSKGFALIWSDAWR